jgi:chorismate mutase
VSISHPALDQGAVADAPAVEIETLRDMINQIDDAIIQLWRTRASVSAEVGALRVAAGGTRIVLARETSIINKFRDRLGPAGTDLALLLLRSGRGPLLSDRPVRTVPLRRNDAGLR